VKGRKTQDATSRQPANLAPEDSNTTRSIHGDPLGVNGGGGKNGGKIKRMAFTGHSGGTARDRLKHSANAEGARCAKESRGGWRAFPAGGTFQELEKEKERSRSGPDIGKVKVTEVLRGRAKGKVAGSEDTKSRAGERKVKLVIGGPPSSPSKERDLRRGESETEQKVIAVQRFNLGQDRKKVEGAERWGRRGGRSMQGKEKEELQRRPKRIEKEYLYSRIFHAHHERAMGLFNYLKNGLGLTGGGVYAIENYAGSCLWGREKIVQLLLKALDKSGKDTPSDSEEDR